MVFAALFAALACVATMSLHIPTPGTGGYIHPGDAIVVLSGILLGPIYGGLAAGLGSALADLLSGYMVYVPITFVVKAVIAVVCYFVYHKQPDCFHRQTEPYHPQRHHHRLLFDHSRSCRILLF